MIKDLIADLAHDKITLSQALTRSKIIAHQINNDNFIKWLINELSGYDNIEYCPSYRVTEAETVAKVRDFSGEMFVPIQDGIGLGADFYIYHITQGIDTIEEVLSRDNAKNSNFVYMQMSPQFTEEMREIIVFNGDYSLISLNKKIGLSVFHKVLNLTKQKLLDTLLELNNAFPNLENNFIPKDMGKKASQIINNNIYGSNNNTNVGVGENVTQTQHITISQTTINELTEKLRTLGVPAEEITEFEDVVKASENKDSKTKKLFAWVGKVAQKSLEKGIELQIPAIIDLIQKVL